MLLTPCLPISGIELEMIPAAMLAQRIMGIMAHWREYMRESKRSQFPLPIQR